MADDPPQVDLAAELAMAQQALAASNRLLKRASERCRLLEAERNTARTDARNEVADALQLKAENFINEADRRQCRYLALWVRGLPVPETNQEQPKGEQQ